MMDRRTHVRLFVGQIKPREGRATPMVSTDFRPSSGRPPIQELRYSVFAQSKECLQKNSFFTSATLLGTSALLVVTRSERRNKCITSRNKERNWNSLESFDSVRTSTSLRSGRSATPGGDRCRAPCAGPETHHSGGPQAGSEREGTGRRRREVADLVFGLNILWLMVDHFTRESHDIHNSRCHL